MSLAPEPAGEIETVGWSGDAATGHVRMIDQTRLPIEFVRLECQFVPAVWEAIRALRVRGAPAIGIAAAYGAVLGGQSALAAGAVHPRDGRRACHRRAAVVVAPHAQRPDDARG